MREFLKNLCKNDVTPLEEFVITNLLEHNGGEDDDEDTQYYMQNIVTEGGEQGAIHSLVYSKHIRAFFNRFSGEILEMLDDYYQGRGGIPVKEFTYSTLAWWSYKQTVSSLLYKFKESVEA